MDKATKNMFELILGKLDGIGTRLDSIEKRLDSVENRLDSVENRLDALETGFKNIEKRQEEMYIIMKSIEHNNEIHKAEIDNIKVRTGYLEGTINNIGEVINTRMVAKG